MIKKMNARKNRKSNKKIAKKFNWTNHLIELIVVFIGITAAFSLNNWQDERKNKKLEENYIQSLLKDINADSVQLEEFITNWQVNLKEVMKLSQLIKQKKFDNDSLLLYAATMSSVEEFNPQNGTYETLTSSGDMGIITNFKLKNQINNLYNAYKDLRQKDQVYSNFNQEYIIPFFFRNFDFADNFRPVNENYMKASDFSNIVFGYIVLVNQKIAGYKECLEKCRQLKVELQKY